MSSKVREVVRARIRDRIRAAQQTEPGLGSVTVAPQKTKAEIQDELTAAGVEYPKKATKAELEALVPQNTTPDLGELAAEDIAETKPT